jgi:hypothetical protein
VATSIDLSGLSADIARLAQRLALEANAAQAKAITVMQDRVAERARQDEHWASLADDISVWSQDGMLVIGVNNQERVSQAMLLEYGDETTPPSPLFRTAQADARAGYAAASDHMKMAFGPGSRIG